MNTQRIRAKIVVKYANGREEEHDFNGHQFYLQGLLKAIDIHTAKNHDYSEEKDPLSNFKSSEKFGLKPELGFMVRMSDKWARLCNFFRKGSYKVKDEKVTDTLIDLANYALLLYAYLHEKKDIETNEEFYMFQELENDLNNFWEKIAKIEVDVGGKKAPATEVLNTIMSTLSALVKIGNTKDETQTVVYEGD